MEEPEWNQTHPIREQNDWHVRYHVSPDRVLQIVENMLFRFSVARMRILQDEVSDLVHQLYESLSTSATEVIEQYRVQEIAAAILSVPREHPVLIGSIAAIIFLLALPCMVFIFFAVAATIVSFTGFLLIEGTWISLVVLLMFALLIGVGGTALGWFALYVFWGYKALPKVYDLQVWISQRIERIRTRDK